MQNKEKLFSDIWKLADATRSSIDGWDFKNYVLGFLFYKYISNNFKQFINNIQYENGDQDFKYELLSDKEAESVKNELIDYKGYFIYPSQLFENMYEYFKSNPHEIENLNEILNNTFKAIQATSNGTKSQKNFENIFSFMNLNNNLLGKSVVERNKKLFEVIQIIHDEFNHFDNSDNDIFGDAYEFLMSMYASNAGKSGGEFFTPQEVSKLLVKISINNKKSIKNAYDPTCGSGSLLLQVKKQLGVDNISDGLYGQENNPTSYDLCRMNMILHNLNYDKFDIKYGDTLIEPQFDLDKKFEVIVSNPPYSIKWIGLDDPTLINDERFSGPGVLAPKSKADFAFILHSLYVLDETGKAAILCFPGIFYRTGAEQKIRKYLIDNNFIDCIINLPDNMFFGTSIVVNLLVLSKSKKDNNILFIDASEFYEKRTKENYLTDDNINQILEIYNQRKDIDNISKLVSYEQIKQNDYNLSVNTYVESKKIKELKENKIDIKALNKEIDQIVNRNDELRNKINKIIKEIDNE